MGDKRSCGEKRCSERGCGDMGIVDPQSQRQTPH